MYVICEHRSGQFVRTMSNIFAVVGVTLVRCDTNCVKVKAKHESLNCWVLDENGVENGIEADHSIPG